MVLKGFIYLIKKRNFDYMWINKAADTPFFCISEALKMCLLKAKAYSIH